MVLSYRWSQQDLIPNNGIILSLVSADSKQWYYPIAGLAGLDSKQWYYPIAGLSRT